MKNALELFVGIDDIVCRIRYHTVKRLLNFI